MKLSILLMILSTLIVACTPEDSILSPGMPLSTAEALLKKHNAKPTEIQVASKHPDQNKLTKFFALADSRVVELSCARKDTTAAWVIEKVYQITWPHPGETREKVWTKLDGLKL